MSSIKPNESIIKSKKNHQNQAKQSRQFGSGINDKRTFDNVIADINLDITRINKKLENQSIYQINIQSLLEEEIKLRQDIEKKTFLINENLNSEMTKTKQNMIDLSEKVNQILDDNLKKINEENDNNKQQFNLINDEINIKIKEYENIIEVNKLLKLIRKKKMKK